MESIYAAPSVWHFLVAFYFAIAFIVARFFLDRFIFRRLSLWLLSRENTLLKLNEATQAKIVKCSESLWKLTYYATVEYCVLATAYNEPWFGDLNQYYSGWPHQELKLLVFAFGTVLYHMHRKSISSSDINHVSRHYSRLAYVVIFAGRLPLKLIYMCQCGFYIFSIAALLFWETRRKDFSVMMSHHVVTVILISASYMTRLFRVGAVILALHDASDVFLEAAKIFKYSGKELGASVCFGFFAVSWLLLRLIFFPFWVIRSTSYTLGKVLDLSEKFHTTIYYLFNTLLLMLLIFHMYWWKLICAMIIRQLKNSGKVGEDVREDSDDD